MRKPAKSISIVLVAAALVAFPAVALAAPSAADRAQAAELKKKGDAEMDSLHYAEALSAYSEAYTLTSDPALLYNRARVLEALLRYADAVDELEKFASEAPPALKARVPKLQELIDELKGKLTKLTVRCPVPNARVLVRDRAIGKTPMDGAVRVNSGAAQIEVVAEGYVPFRKSVELPGGGELVVDAPLAMRDARGRLVVSSTPAGAEVSVDGRSLGIAPAEAELSPGNHKIVLSLTGYRDTVATAVIVEGQRKTLDVTLDKKPPITSTWWFWTGVGVVVVGATTATLVYALGTERSASTGDIAPGQVAGPLRF
jgi:hypothetical protein